MIKVAPAAVLPGHGGAEHASCGRAVRPRAPREACRSRRAWSVTRCGQARRPALTYGLLCRGMASHPHGDSGKSSLSIRSPSSSCCSASAAISDQIGRRATMLAGLLASLAGALLFGGRHPTWWWVFRGDVVLNGPSGVGLAASPVDRRNPGVHEPGNVRRSAASVTMGGASHRLRHGFAARRRLDAIRAMADPPLLLGTCALPHRPSDRDLALAASYARRRGRGRRTGARQCHPFPRHVRRAFAVDIDRDGRRLYIRRPRALGSAARSSMT